MQEKLNIAFAGTPEIAIPFLDELNKNELINVKTVITQEDKPVGRKKKLTEPPVKSAAKLLNLPVLQPPTLKNNQEFKDLLQNLNLDFIVVIAYGHIFPKSILDIPKIGCINVHASLLPKYRGASPIQNALLNNEDETGFSVIHMSEKMDKGDIYYLQRIPINEDDNYKSLTIKISQIGSKIIPSLLLDIKDDVIKPIPQNGKNASYCTKIQKEDGEVNLEKENVEDIIAKYKAFIEWPGIYIWYNSKKIKLLEMETYKYISDLIANKSRLIKHNEDLLALAKNGAIKINRLQPEGKNPMDAKAFINGYL